MRGGPGIVWSIACRGRCWHDVRPQGATPGGGDTLLPKEIVNDFVAGLRGSVLGGELLYPVGQARPVYDFYAGFTHATPDELHLTLALDVSGPGGDDVTSREGAWVVR